MNNLYLLAQRNALGNDSARNILESSSELTRNTAESWDRIWDLTIVSSEPLWQALVELGAFIAAMSIIYLTIKEGERLIDNPSWQRLIVMLRFPLAIAILLGGNGFFLAGVVRYIRAISYFWLTRVLDLTFAGISISDAIQKIQNTSVADSRGREIFAECIDKTGLALQTCLEDPVKIQQASNLMQTLSGNNGQTTPLNGNLLASIAQGGDMLAAQVTGIVAVPFLNFIQIFLIGLQWAFINGIEASLVLTALFAPIALGLSMIPSAGPTIFAWFSGFLALFLMQIGYVIIVGITALILSLTEQAGQPIGSTILDIGFLLFLSIIAPIIAGAIARGGGIALFNGISRSATLAVQSSARMAFAFTPVPK